MSEEEKGYGKPPKKHQFKKRGFWQSKRSAQRQVEFAKRLKQNSEPENLSKFERPKYAFNQAAGLSSKSCQ